MIAMINEENFAELIFGQVTDSKVWCRLSQISTKFNQASKRKLIKKEKQVRGYKTSWTELPDGKKHGLFKSWYPSGQIFEESYYLNKKLNCLYKRWYPNGQIEIENNILNGKKHGLYKKWYPNGQIEIENNYLNGLKQGLCKSYFKNTELLYDKCWVDLRGQDLCRGLPKNEYSCSEANFVNDIRHGLARSWYSNEQLMCYCDYSNGQKNGEYKWWNKEGHLVIDEHYLYDALI